MTEKRKVAVFDIDGTIFRSSLLIELVNALIHEGIFDDSVRAHYVEAYGQWQDRKGDYPSYINAVVKVFLESIKRVDETKFRRVAMRVAAFHKDRTYRYTRDLIAELKEKEYFLLAISHSPKIILDTFCDQLGFDKVYGTLLATKFGRFTGEIEDPNIFDKGKIFDQAREKENLVIEGSVGVGDTESDILLLQKVEKPIAFNPNKGLCEHARKEGWEIVVERKDVIYKF